jgi:hypothetical protein
MTSEEKARIRELPILIANENDPEKMKLFAAELERLLVAETRERTESRMATNPLTPYRSESAL